MSKERITATRKHPEDESICQHASWFPECKEDICRVRVKWVAGEIFAAVKRDGSSGQDHCKAEIEQSEGQRQCPFLREDKEGD